MDITWNNVFYSFDKKIQLQILSYSHIWLVTEEEMLNILNYVPKTDILAAFISHIFQWDQTTEGDDYWLDIYYSYQNKLINKVIWI